MAITNEIAAHFKSVSLCVPCVRVTEPVESRYRDNVKIVPLPPYKNRLELLLTLPCIVRLIKREITRHSLLYAMGPNDLGVLGMVLARVSGIPFFASLDTDRARRVLTRDYGIFARTVKRTANTLLLYPLIEVLCKDVPVFVTGDLFLSGGKHWRQWIKTTVREEDIPARRPVRPISIDDVPTIVFVGRLSPEKNVAALLAAVKELGERGRRTRLLIVGDGEERERLETLAGNYGLGNITFIGRLANFRIIASRFLGADVLVLPSKEERQGKVLLEAMACSVPVVAARAGGIPSVITHGENGLLFDPNSPVELANALEDVLFGSIERRNALVEAGWEFARAHSLDKEVKGLIEDVRAWWVCVQANGSSVGGVKDFK
jgi:glycosyltransferase involved in cell wall biosynthesis